MSAKNNIIGFLKKIPKPVLAIVSILIIAGLIYGVTVAFQSNNSDEQALAEAILNTAKNNNINADLKGSVNGKAAYIDLEAEASFSKAKKDSTVAFGSAKVDYGSGIGDKKDSKQLIGEIRSYLDKNTTYVKVGDLSVVLDTLNSQLSQAGASSGTIKSIIDKINNKWVKLKTAEGDENLSMQCLGGMYNKLISNDKYQEEFMRIYSKNKFYDVISKDKKGSTTSYAVEYNTDLAKKFFQSLTDTKMFKDTKKCRKSLDIFNIKNNQVTPSDQETKPNIQIVIDVDNKNSLVSDIRLDMAQSDANAKLTIKMNFDKKAIPSEPHDTTDMSTIQPELMQIVGSMRDGLQKQQGMNQGSIPTGLGPQVQQQ